MSHAVQWLRSAVFVAQMYLAMAVLALIFTPLAVFHRRYAYAAMHSYCRWVRFSARWLVGLRSEVRGEAPSDEVVIAAKHQSFFDIIILFSAVPRGRFIMKRELIWAPILGWYALRIGCVPVDRGKRGQAIAAMMKSVADGRQEPGQLLIYPQGTRVAPDAKMPYKMGTAALYAQLGQDCVPAATNVGHFWPRRGILRKPGLAVVEFLPRIRPGLSHAAFMAELERRVETASDRLLAEARGKAMASDAALVADLLDAMRGAGAVSARKMFGEYAVYLDGKVVALICDNALFVKPTAAGRARRPDAVLASPYPGAKPHLRIDDALDEPDALGLLIATVARDLPPPKPRKRG